MFGKLALIALLLAAVKGDVIRESVAARSHGSHNLYYLYARGKAVANLPTAAELENPFPPAPVITPDLSPEIDTVVIAHGHDGDLHSPVNEEIRAAFFNDRARPGILVNIIVLDWSDFTKQSYTQSSLAVQNVGKVLGEYLKILSNQGRIALNRLHLIGFNLGAHVVGFAGRELGGAAARITGLDPAASNWGSNSPRLTKTDAKYVEVIHTDGDCLLCNGIGKALGHVDFFVNGGSNQPGCLTHSCSHNRAYTLYAATLVRDEPLIGRQCTSQLQITLSTCRGFPVELGGDQLYKEHTSNNLYRVNTGRNYPF